MAQALPFILIVAAYLIGSIPFSFLVVKIVAGADIRTHGSRNVGATNVARNFGKAAGDRRAAARYRERLRGGGAGAMDREAA